MRNLEILRAYLPDADGAVWSDGELESLLDVARIAYSRDTGIFRATAPLHVDEDGTGELPAGCLEVKGAWNGEAGMPLRRATVHGLERRDPYWQDATGQPLAILQDGAAKYRLHPNPFDLQEESTAAVAHNYGGSTAYGYGVLWFDMLGDEHPRTRYGVEGPEDGYGVACGGEMDSTGNMMECGHTWNPPGDLLYTYTGREDEVADHMALVLYAAYLAYLADTDFVNPALAQDYLSRYRSRVAALGRIVSGHGRRTGGNYY